jgi:hypothetical protein
MESPQDWRRSDTFLVKVFRDTAGALSGFIEHVRTGEREHFVGIESLGEAIGRLTAHEDDGVQPAPPSS